MKILLVNPPFSYQTPWVQVTEPLGLLYLSSYIRKFSKHEVSVLDCLASHRVKKLNPRQYWYGLFMEEMLDGIKQFNPDVIGITCMFSRKKDDFFSCAHSIRNRFSESILVAGGTHPSLFAEEVIKTKFFDYCIIGEGEASFLDLINRLSYKTKPLEHIEGIAFMRNSNVHITPKKNYIDDLDKIPFPSRDLINYEAYVSRKNVLHGLGLGRAASIITSRSCPNRCNFCSMYKIHGPRWRGRSAKNVVDEIIELKERYSIEELFIMDDNFTFYKERVMEICERINKSKIKIHWNTPNGISINTLDKELLSVMKKSGCKSICIAIESGDEELRNKVIGKHLTNKKIEEVTKNAAKLGLFIIAFYIIGMPGETKEKFNQTLEQVKKLPFNGVAAAFANPMPGTKLYQDCLDNNWTILEENKGNDNIFYKPYIITKDFSEKELLLREKHFYYTFLFARLFTILKDTLFFRNGLLYPPFLMRIIKDRFFRQ